MTGAGIPYPADSLDAEARMPHHMFWMLIGLGVLFIVSLVCLIFFGLKPYNRPEDLREATAAAAKNLQQVLVAAGIPAADIKQGGPQIRTDKYATWNAYAFTVSVNGQPDQNAIRNLIRREIPKVAITETAADGKPSALVLANDQREFAVLDVAQKPQNKDLTAECAEAVAEIEACMIAQGIPEPAIQKSESESKQEDITTWTHTRFDVTLARTLSVEQLEAALRTALAARAARVGTRLGIRGTSTIEVSLQNCMVAEIFLAREDGAMEDPQEPLVDMKLKISKSDVLLDLEQLPLDSHDLDDVTLGQKLNLNMPAPEAAKKKPRVAIIVDDGGFGGAVREKILVLDPNLTLAIMPDGPYTAETARRGKEAGFQIMLHLPMQGTIKPEGLTPKMSAQEIRKISEVGFAKVPGAVGINNHMGSIFTAHEDVVTWFVEYIKEKKDVFIIDSLTTGRSKLLTTARKMGVPSGSRDIFLDMEKDPGYIRNQFRQMMAMAKRRGQAIAIGHFRENTAMVLGEMLPELEKDGIELVHASELVH